MPSIQRHATPRTKAVCEQQKALNGKLDAFNISNSLFFCGLSKHKLRRVGRKTMGYHKKARNTNNYVLEPKLPHAFRKWSCCWEAMNCTYRNWEVKACVKVNPLSFFPPVLYVECTYFPGKIEELIMEQSSFPPNSSQFLYWCPAEVKNKARLLSLKTKWEFFLYEPLWRWRCTLALSEWGLFVLSHFLGYMRWSLAPGKSWFTGHSVSDASLKIKMHHGSCLVCMTL